MGLVGDMNTTGAGSGIAHFAHIGGSFYGIWFGYELRKNNKDITKGFGNFMNEFFAFFKNSGKKKAPKMKVQRGPKQKVGKPKSDWEYNQTKADDQQELNRVLDKISKSGYDSLSKQEKDFLFKQKDK